MTYITLLENSFRRGGSLARPISFFDWANIGNLNILLGRQFPHVLANAGSSYFPPSTILLSPSIDKTLLVFDPKTNSLDTTQSS